MSDISQFLTSEELHQVTGYKASYKQIKWLRSNGWSFIVNAANHPIVHRSIMLIKLGVCIPDQNQQSTKSNWKPDLTRVS